MGGLRSLPRGFIGKKLKKCFLKLFRLFRPRTAEGQVIALKGGIIRFGDQGELSIHLNSLKLSKI